MFHLSTAMDGDVICNSKSSLALFKNLIHLLEDVFGTDKSKKKSQETVSSEGAVECHKQARLLVEDN